MRTFLILSLALAAASAFAKGEWVDPGTASTPPPPPPPKPGTRPPECVNKVLETLFDKEKAYFDGKKAYSESLLEIHAISAIGLGCPGWDLPVLKITYGGSGYTATMKEQASGSTWTINQDRAFILDEKEAKKN